MQIGVVGCGHWGRNYVRVLSSLVGEENVVIWDDSRTALAEVHLQFPHSVIADSENILLEQVEGVIIATPPTTHYHLVMQALMARRDVLVEKPMAMNYMECQDMIDMADTHRCVLLVGHTFLYNPAILEAKDQLASWKFRRIYYLEAFRRHLGLIREDVDVLWDLAAHDISIFNYWLEAAPLSVQAIGWSFIFGERADTASLFLNYPGGTRGAIHVSWIDSSKRREIFVVGDRAKLCFDDLNPEVLVIEDKGAILGGGSASFEEFKACVLTGGSHVLRILKEEPLLNLCQHFISCINRVEHPRTSGVDGQRVVKVLEAASVSLRKDGVLVEVGKHDKVS